MESLPAAPTVVRCRAMLGSGQPLSASVGVPTPKVKTV